MKSSMWCAIAMLVTANLMFETKAQECLNQLAPYLNYLNGTKDVPEICCNPLKLVIKNNPGCLCRMISNRGSSQAERAGIDVNEAQMLPARCGEHVKPLACLARSRGSGNSEQTSAGTHIWSHSEWKGAAVMLLTSLQIYWMSSSVLAST